MTKVILNQDQSYISVEGTIKFGKKGSTINADDKFLTFIKGKFASASEKVDKPIDKMNKVELIELLKTTNTDISEEDLEIMTKAQIIKLIQEV